MDLSHDDWKAPKVFLCGIYRLLFLRIPGIAARNVLGSPASPAYAGYVNNLRGGQERSTPAADRVCQEEVGGRPRNVRLFIWRGG
jgi:hypothetical protein